LFISNSVFAALSFALLPLCLLVTLVGLPSFLTELPKALSYYQRVNRAIEATVAASLEAGEKQHQLRYFQIVELRADNKGAFLEGLTLQLALAAAVLGKVV